MSPFLLLPIALLSFAPAEQTVSFVVIEDDGTVQDTPFDTQTNALAVINALLDRYEDTGSELPEVLSVWTAFPFNDNVFETRFIPVANDVTGIGLEHAYGVGEELFDQYPPLRAMLIHNDATALRERADLERLTGLEEGAMADYLFLLELSHLWGPEIRLPGEAPAAPPARAIGFDFHWSFFLDHPDGTGVAGGNGWSDDGDGAFTVQPVDYANLAFSPLELYLMGLVPPEEVPAFGLVRDAVVPDGAIDPFSNRRVSAASFPWQGPDALTVTGTYETLTIDDVIAANGARSPAFGVAPTSFTLATALVIPAGTTPQDRDALVRAFAPIADRLPLAFARATGDRGALTVVATSPAPPPLLPPDDAEESDDERASEPEATSGGCVQAAPSTWIAIVGFMVKKSAKRRRRRDGSTSSTGYAIEERSAPHTVPRPR